MLLHNLDIAFTAIHPHISSSRGEEIKKGNVFFTTGKHGAETSIMREDWNGNGANKTKKRENGPILLPFTEINSSKFPAKKRIE